jgi:hypothetical protein
MWWRKHGHSARLIFAAASLTAGCFEPLYANRPAAGITQERAVLDAQDRAKIVAEAIRNRLASYFVAGT